MDSSTAAGRNNDLKTSELGRLFIANPLREARLPVPEYLEPSRHSGINWNMGKAQFRQVPGKLLSGFVMLKDAPDWEILKFAKSYGPLGICHHGCPSTHQVGRSSCRPLVSIDADILEGDAFERLFEWSDIGEQYFEPYAAWRHFAEAFASLLLVATAIRDGRDVAPNTFAATYFALAHQDDWERDTFGQLDPTSDWRMAYTLAEFWEKRAKYMSPIHRANVELQLVVESFLHIAGASVRLCAIPPIDPIRPRYGLAASFPPIRPVVPSKGSSVTSLFGALLSLFLGELAAPSGQQHWHRCEQCGVRFYQEKIPTRGRPPVLCGTHWKARRKEQQDLYESKRAEKRRGEREPVTPNLPQSLRTTADSDGL